MAAPTPPTPGLRKEVQDYIQACEQLLSPLMFSNDAPMSTKERKMIEYYQEEVKRQLLESEPRTSVDVDNADSLEYLPVS